VANIWYATREDVKGALDSKLTARDDAQVDRAIATASRDLEGALHRRFYPEVATRRFDWPNQQYARPWRLWLDSNELISITTLSSGGTVIDPAHYFLRRSDDLDEAPYTQVQLDLDGPASFGGGGSHQRDISITGLWAGCRLDEVPAGALEAAVADASTTTVDVTDGALVGVGSLLRVGTERLVVAGRTWLDSGQNLGAPGLTAQANSVLVAVTTGSAFHAGEVVLIDAERMLVVDVAGDQLVVKRAWDGSVLAAHTAGADIYVPRRLTVERGVLGTTAAAHGDAAPVVAWRPPSVIGALCIAEAIAQVEQEQSGYARTVGAGDNEREARGAALADLRRRAYTDYGRKARIGAV
jgi:hypothetical protein